MDDEREFLEVMRGLIGARHQVPEPPETHEALLLAFRDLRGPG